jgi:hypothetical protein
MITILVMLTLFLIGIGMVILYVCHKTMTRIESLISGKIDIEIKKKHWRIK